MGAAIHDTAELEGGQRIKLNRGQHLLRVGDHDQRVFQIESGLLCAYGIVDGAEQIIRFGYAGEVLVSVPSFFTGGPSHIGLKALRATVVLCHSKQRFIELRGWRTDDWNSLLTKLIEQQCEREIDLLTGSPSDRINRVRKRSPQLFEQVPLKFIANYLRMTPETLSRNLINA